MEAVAEAVIADARRRHRNRRLALFGVVVVVGSLAGFMLSQQGAPGPAPRARLPEAKSAPAVPTGLARTSEVVVGVAWSGSLSTPRFRQLPSVMRRPRLTSDAVPRLDRRGVSKATPHFRRSFGRLLYAESRAVVDQGETLFLVPTGLGGICVLGAAESFGCMRGFDSAGIAWTGHTIGSANTMAFVGVAAPSVRSIELVSKPERIRAHLQDGFFWLDWPIELSGGLQPSLKLNGRFVVRYRDGRRPASEPLRTP